MDKFEETALETKNLLKTSLKKDASKEEIDLEQKLEKQIDSLIQSHGETKQKFDEMKDDYLNLIKNSSTSKPNTDSSSNSNKEFDIDDQKALEEDMENFFKDEKDNKDK